MINKIAKMLTLSLLILCVMATSQVFSQTTPAQMVADAKAQIMHVSADVVKVLFDTKEYAFVDVREPSETRMGYIPGAFLIPRGLVEFRIGSTIEDKNAKIVVYCKSGGRSSLATLALKNLGYTNVISMDGGFSAWQEAGYPMDE